MREKKRPTRRPSTETLPMIAVDDLLVTLPGASKSATRATITVDDLLVSLPNTSPKTSTSRATALGRKTQTPSSSSDSATSSSLKMRPLPHLLRSPEMGTQRIMDRRRVLGCPDKTSAEENREDAEKPATFVRQDKGSSGVSNLQKHLFAKIQIHKEGTTPGISPDEQVDGMMGGTELSERPGEPQKNSVSMTSLLLQARRAHVDILSKMPETECAAKSHEAKMSAAVSEVTESSAEATRNAIDSERTRWLQHIGVTCQVMAARCMSLTDSAWTPHTQVLLECGPLPRPASKDYPTICAQFRACKRSSSGSPPFLVRLRRGARMLRREARARRTAGGRVTLRNHSDLAATAPPHISARVFTLWDRIPSPRFA